MKFFANKRPVTPDPSTERFRESVELLKVAVSQKLTAWSERVSPRTRKVSLIVFGIGISVISLSLILSPLTKRRAVKTDLFTKGHQPLLPPLNTESPISQEDLNTMISFKHLLDSLQKNDPAAYRMIIEGRQGLVDSIDFLIQYSHKQ